MYREIRFHLCEILASLCRTSQQILWQLIQGVASGTSLKKTLQKPPTLGNLKDKLQELITIVRTFAVWNNIAQSIEVIKIHQQSENNYPSSNFMYSDLIKLYGNLAYLCSISQQTFWRFKALSISGLSQTRSLQKSPRPLVRSQRRVTRIDCSCTNL